MVSTILTLPLRRQLEVLALVAPSDVGGTRSRQDASAQIVSALRIGLDVPDGEDLPEYARRRLVELARDDFSLAPSFDTFSSVEVASALTVHILSAATTLSADANQRREFAR